MLWLNVLAVCALVASVWWFLWTMRRAHAELCKAFEAMQAVMPVVREMHTAFDQTLHDGLMEQARSFDVRQDRLCKLLGYRPEDFEDDA